MFYLHSKSGCNPNYKDKDNQTCNSYVKNNWCTETGTQGSAWDNFPQYPPIDEYFNEDGESPLVCPQCGCGKGNNVLEYCDLRCY